MYMTMNNANHASSRRSIHHSIATAGWFFTRILDQIAAWQDQARGRRELAQMSDALLHDIGISRRDAIKEASKPFWRQ